MFVRARFACVRVTAFSAGGKDKGGKASAAPSLMNIVMELRKYVSLPILRPDHHEHANGWAYGRG
eukprot:2772332-Pleurochrysis_carterae.AAC.2